MKTNNKSNSSSNTESLIFKTKTQKKRVILVAGLIVAAIMTGWFLNFILSGKAQGKPGASTNDKITLNFENSDFSFLNPYLQTVQNEKNPSPELDNFKYLVENYCKSAKNNKTVNDISVYFRDMTNGAWFGYNENEKYIPASLTKVPLMIIAFQQAENDPEYLNKRLIYNGSPSAEYLDAHPEIDHIRTAMKVNESYSVEELIDLMITKSDNEAAMLILNDLGMNKLQDLQKQLGNKVPVDAPSATNILTAKNFSSFFRILYNSSLLNRKYSEKALEILSHSEYEKGIRQAVPSDIRVCQKYGERDTFLGPTVLKIQQLHQAGIVYYPRKPYFICIMTKGSNKQNMEKVLFDISKIVYDEVDNQVKICQKSTLMHDIN